MRKKEKTEKSRKGSRVQGCSQSSRPLTHTHISTLTADQLTPSLLRLPLLEKNSVNIKCGAVLSRNFSRRIVEKEAFCALRTKLGCVVCWSLSMPLTIEEWLSNIHPLCLSQPFSLIFATQNWMKVT